ncbi:MAG: aromatic ring-hydroxylating dioxygenase subunit alpha [Hyphomicrobiaceae bacterium]
MAGEMIAPDDYNGLTELKASLPASTYYDPERFERELKALWYRNWIYVCRASEIAEPRSYVTDTIGTQPVLLVRGEDGVIRGFFNTCRHRGSVLCTEHKGTLKGRLIVCPYHAWSFDLEGALRRSPTLRAPDGFERADHGLLPIAVHEWRGFVFVNLAGAEATDFMKSFRREPTALDNWPLEDLVVGHRFEKEVACNWKIFWENYSECLHCPGVHPELCDLVPIYSRAIMDEKDDPDWAAHRQAGDPALAGPRYEGGLKTGAETWAMDGRAHGVALQGLSEADKAAGMTFVTLLPSFFAVGHVDYARAVSLRPLGPERTLLTAEWLFMKETLADPQFDMANVVEFAKIVLGQDAMACELNQKGLRAEAFKNGVLFPEEYYVHQVQEWVRRGMGEAPQIEGDAEGGYLSLGPKD